MDSLISCCKKITKILNWFHIRQAHEKRREYKDQLKSSKYKVWHGKPEDRITKLQ